MSSTRQSETGQLGRVIIKHARDAMIDDAQIDAQWRQLNYPDRPDLLRAQREYEAFATALRAAGAEVIFLPPDPATGMDSLYPRDAAVVSENGAVLCSMGKPARRGEPAALRKLFDNIDVKILGEIADPGKLEGGDVVWLTERVIAVGNGYRSNEAGIDQLRQLLADTIDELVVVDLPHWQGPDDVFHLMSMISPIDTDLVAVYSPLLPVPFRQRLLSMGFELVEIPTSEFATQACNILALAPRRVLLVGGNPITQSRLLDAGVDVRVYSGNEISLKGGGGPTCLTRPIERFS